MNIKQLLFHFENFHPMHHTLVLEANHGCGKSEIVREDLRALVAKMHGVTKEEVGIIDRRASLLDPSDLIGGIFLVGGRTYNAPPSWLPVHKDSVAELSGPLTQNGMAWTDFAHQKYGILFLDEINRGNPQTRNSMFELTLDRSLHGVKIPDTWYIVAAINGNTELYSVDPMEPAEMDRLVLVKFNPSYEELYEHLNKRTFSGAIHDAVTAYCKMFEDHIDPSVEVIEKARADGDKTYSRRSWYRLGESLKKAEKSGMDITEMVKTSEGYDALRMAAEGYVGATEAAAFVDFVKESYDVITPDAILNRWNDAMKDRIEAMADTDSELGNVPALSGLANALLEELKNKVGDVKLAQKQQVNIAEFLEVMPREVVSGFWVGWSKTLHTQAVDWHKTPRRQNITTRSVCNEAGYQQWVRDMAKGGIKDLTSDKRLPWK